MSLLSSRSVIGEFHAHLEQDAGQHWMHQISMLFQSSQESETYAWLGQTPSMQEWIGGRKAKGLHVEAMTIRNIHFEATLEVALRDKRLDKTGQLLLRIQELALRTNAHWAKLLTALIAEGETGLCYDGHYFFDTQHQEGKSAVQSNRVVIPLSSLPLDDAERGTPTAPSAKAMKTLILKGVQTILGFKDDQEEPMNENASQFLVMVPTSLMDVTHAAIASPVLSGAETNELAVSRNFGLDYVVNARLPWADKFALFRSDGAVAPFIRQEETPVDIKTIAEGSELEFNEDKHRYGVDCWRNVGYGYWQKACLIQLVS
jgi:phage major head subunit gpT-like protein